MKNEIKNFKRIEMKYILTLKQKEDLLKKFTKELIPDTNWNSSGNYKLESLYYDTDDLKFYWEKADGSRYRKKLRIRRYVDQNWNFDENSKVFVEIKEKVDEITEKRRVKMTYKEAKNLVEKWIIPEHKEQDKAVIDEIYILAKQNSLKPKAITSYDRQAFFGTNSEIWLRITFDTEVFYKRNDLFLNNKNKKDWNIVEQNFTIMEVKANSEIPEFILKFLEENNITPTRFSKYCQAIESSEKDLKIPLTQLDYYNFFEKKENLKTKFALTN